MRFKTLVLLAGVLLAAPAAMATPARVVGLGDLGRYVQDDSNVLTYPSLIGRHTHLLYVDLGGKTGVSPSLSETQATQLNGGVFFKVFDGLSLGLVASDFQPSEHADFLRQVAAGANAANQAAFTDMADSAALRRYDVIAGYDVSQTLSLGLRLSYGSFGETFTPDSSLDKDSAGLQRQGDARSQSQFRAVGGATVALSPGATLDAALDYSRYGLAYEKNGKDAFMGGGGNAVGLSVRGTFAASRMWDVIPQVAYRLTSFGLNEDMLVPDFGEASNQVVTELPNKGKRVHTLLTHELDLGAAGALHVNKQVTFYLAGGIALKSGTQGLDVQKDGADFKGEVSESLMSLPYVKFAVETEPLEWLRLRAGVEKYTWTASETTALTQRGDAPVQSTRSESGTLLAANEPDFGAFLGASIVSHGFTVDLVLDNGFLMRGPNFVSGAAGNIAGRASLAYRF